MCLCGGNAAKQFSLNKPTGLNSWSSVGLGACIILHLPMYSHHFDSFCIYLFCLMGLAGKGFASVHPVWAIFPGHRQWNMFETEKKTINPSCFGLERHGLSVFIFSPWQNKREQLWAEGLSASRHADFLGMLDTGRVHCWIRRMLQKLLNY